MSTRPRAGKNEAVAALVALFAFPAHADVSGPACVTDGDTLVVNGKRQHTRCVGGTRVRLFGIDAPELKQRCKHANGQDFLCGRAAASFLLEHVRGRAVECRGNSEDRYGRLIAICFVDGKFLGTATSANWNVTYPDTDLVLEQPTTSETAFVQVDIGT